MTNKEAKERFWDDDYVEEKHLGEIRWHNLTRRVFCVPCNPDSKGLDEFYQITMAVDKSENGNHELISVGPVKKRAVLVTTYA